MTATADGTEAASATAITAASATASAGPSAEGQLQPTEAIAQFAVRPRDRSVSVPHLDAVIAALIDTAAVTIAGTGTEPVRALLSWLDDELSVGPATAWGTHRRMAPSVAALVNGTAAHALDWDDASPSMPMHPGAVLFPALVARASVAPTDAATFAEAYNVGSAVFRAVSEALPLSVHYGRGWHNTSTTGRLAATAAVARVAGLDLAQTQCALGIAASMASGSLANFGTMTKPLHAGLAARDAVTAVGLAERGFTAHPAQLEAVGGFFALFGDATPELLAGLPERLEFWEREWVSDWAIKRYPSCYGTHRAIDAALELRPLLGVGGISEVHVLVHRSGLRPLITALPTTGLEGKFSMEYTVARALEQGEVRLGDFTDDQVADPSRRRLVERVRVAEAEDPDDAGSPDPFTVLTVHTDDGAILTRRVDVSRGDARNPLSQEDLDAKAIEACAEAGWTEEETSVLVDELRSLMHNGDLSSLQEVLARSAWPERADDGLEAAR